jgi:hypothetical protein
LVKIGFTYRRLRTAAQTGNAWESRLVIVRFSRVIEKQIAKPERQKQRKQRR